MEDLETNLIQTRKACRIEQMVAKWLHRSRDGASRGRVSVTDSTSDGSGQPASRVKLTVTVYKDLVLHHYGFEICPNLPLTIASVTAGKDCFLLPTITGESPCWESSPHLPESAAAPWSGWQHARSAKPWPVCCTLGCTQQAPPQKAFWESFSVVWRFFYFDLFLEIRMMIPSEELLELSELKVMRFLGHSVKDIVLTLKEKLSIRNIAHFALVLEEQYNVAKIHLLHEEELIEQVVKKRESHDYRCLFRVCFVPKDPLDLLQEDPIAFEYLYLQSCSDVLQERFAVEMKCSVALRLAALHIQERIYACAQPQKVSLKYIERDWGIENFVSPTLLRNMRGKDIKKAISYHMKRNQVLLDPRQKHMLAAVQVRLSYLQILGDLKMYNGKIFNATLMLQDRESYVALLVGAKYGVSQIINNKLNIITSLAEFANISRVELTEESEKVSMVKIYLQDLKLLTLLLESNSAKDLVCLIIGYYRLFVDANVSLFTWGEKKQQLHRVSAEEGYESRTCSDSEDSWELDSSSEHCLDTSIAYSRAHPVCNEEELGELHSLEMDSTKPQAGGSDQCNGGDNATDSTSEASDSANTESRGFKTSGSSDSMDALEEDELETCSSSRSAFFHFYTPTVQEMSSSDKSFFPIRAAEGSSRAETRDYFCFLQVPHTEEPGCEDSPSEQRGGDMGASVLETRLPERNTVGYYSLCYSISPAGSVERSNISCSPQKSPWKNGSAQEEAPPCGAEQMAEASDLILEPPPGFGETSSEEEFYDAADRLSPPDALAGKPSVIHCSSSCILKKPRCYSLGENLMTRQTAREKHRKGKELTYAKSLRKRRSFLKTDYTSQVTFPLALPGSLQSCCSSPAPPPLLAQSPAPPSSENIKDAELGLPAATQAQRDTAGTNPSSDLMEMEPDTMETKSVTNSVVSSISAVCLQGEANAQHREESVGVAIHVDGGLQPAHAVHPPFLSLEEAVPLPGGQSRAAQESSSMKTNTGWPSEESCVATRGWLTQVALKEVGEAMAAQHKAGNVPPFPGPEVTCPANEHTLLPAAHDPSVASPYEVAQDQELLPMAGGQAACEEPVLAPCEERKANCDSCAENSSASALPQAKSRQVINKEALRKVHNKNHVGFPDALQLLTDCSSTSGIITRLSWLSFAVRTDFTSPSPSQERVDTLPEHLDSQKTSGCLGPGAVRKEMQTSPAGPPFEKELVSSQGLDEGASRKDAGNVAHKQPQPVQTPLLREQATEVGKDSPLTPSVGLSISSDRIPLGSLGKRAGDHGVSKHSFLCFNHKKDEQTLSDPIVTRSLDLSTMKTSSPLQLGMDKCSCQLSYISCFHKPDARGEHETTIPTCSTFLGPLTTPPSSSCSLPGAPVDGYPVLMARDVAWCNPYVQALSQLKDQAQMSPADFSCFLAYTTELQEVVGKLSGNQATHLQDQCAEQGAESKGTLCLASQDLLSSCQKLLKTEQPLKELQGVLRVTFDHLVQLAVACFQVTHCQLCRQRQQELGAALVDVVGTYHQLVQAVHQQLRRQGCPDLGAKLVARQHTALTAAMFCLLQQVRVPP
ncbi:FERM and PDZ domain-containing protein 1, partial [Gavia stellata]